MQAKKFSIQEKSHDEIIKIVSDKTKVPNTVLQILSTNMYLNIIDPSRTVIQTLLDRDPKIDLHIIVIYKHNPEMTQEESADIEGLENYIEYYLESDFLIDFKTYINTLFNDCLISCTIYVDKLSLINESVINRFND